MLSIAASLLLASAAAGQARPLRPSGPGAAPAAPQRNPELLHRGLSAELGQKQAEQEAQLRKLLELGGPPAEMAEVLSRLASFLRSQGLEHASLAQAAQGRGDEALAAKEAAKALAARNEAAARYRELLRHPEWPRKDEALFFLADVLEDAGRDGEAVAAAAELTRRFGDSSWAPASHVFLGEHEFEQGHLAQALAEYQAAAKAPGDEVYAYALYKEAWCRFNQREFREGMSLLKRVVDVSAPKALTARATAGGGDASTLGRVQLAREARRDYVIFYARAGLSAPEAREQFGRSFGRADGDHMLSLYAGLLFDQGRDDEARVVLHKLLSIDPDSPAAVLHQTRLMAIAARNGKRSELLAEAAALVSTDRRLSGRPVRTEEEKSALADAQRMGEETLRTLAVQTHAEARKTHRDETFAAARALYEDYLALFPSAPEAYNLRFYAGELLFGLGEKGRAAALYEQVVDQDLAARRSKAAAGKWLLQASWALVLSRDAVAAASASGEAEAKAAADAGHPHAPSAAQADLERACSLYLEATPDGAHAVEVAYKLGRLQYLRGELNGAQSRLAWVALKHPEHELAEFAANLVLDIQNLRKDYGAVHLWAEKFLQEPRLLARPKLAADLRRIEEQSAFNLSAVQAADDAKARTLLAFADAHPSGQLTDRALFEAAAALSRAGRIDEAIAARGRLTREHPTSPLSPRALLASASDRAAVGDLEEAASLLEQYAAGYRKQEASRKWRREHPAPHRTPLVTLFDGEKAQSALHDAAVLREARNELARAVADRTAALEQWKTSANRDEERLALQKLRARLGLLSSASRELAALGRDPKASAKVRLEAWRQAARLLTRLGEKDHAAWAWTELARTWKALGPARRESVGDEGAAAAAEAHLALGQKEREEFEKVRIVPPLMRALNRKVALLQRIKKRSEETLALRQAEPAVCALTWLGQAQIELGHAIVESPVPRELPREQRGLYRQALAEKAGPIIAEGKSTLHTAVARARELAVSGACPARADKFLAKEGEAPGPQPVVASELPWSAASAPRLLAIAAPPAGQVKDAPPAVSGGDDAAPDAEDDDASGSEE